MDFAWFASLGVQITVASHEDVVIDTRVGGI
jgi:hypothetical protein